MPIRRPATMPERKPRRRLSPRLDALEPRLCLSASRVHPSLAGGKPGPAGIDALAIGDVNGDQVADFAVACHSGKSSSVTIYSGWGQQAATSTGFAPLALATIEDPLGKSGGGRGGLRVALADLNGDGVSELVVGSASTGKVAAYSFKVQGPSPVNAPVTASLIAGPTSLPGLRGASRLGLAAGDLDGDGRDEVVATAQGRRAVTAYALQGTSWVKERSFAPPPVPRGEGLDVAVGDVTGDGRDDVAVASLADGKVSVYDPSLGQWVATPQPLRARAGTARVTIVESKNAPGALVETGRVGRGPSRAALGMWGDPQVSVATPVVSPGGGDLIPLGAGFVYQRSTLQGLDSSFPYSNGPVTPSVFFASTGSAGQVILQGFGQGMTPSKADTYVESVGTSSGVFSPIQARTDAASGDSAALGINLVAYPSMNYTSPYRIDLSSASSGFDAGLWNRTVTDPSASGWGPDKSPNNPPTVPSGASNDWLRQRVIAAYMSQIGVDYQHHHDPTWSPVQGSSWNATSTVAYQSQGVDCTNFTAWAYADALGVTINSDTTQQALISASNPNGTVIPASLADRVAIQTIDHWSSYQDLVSQLEPGDILIINGDDSDPTKATHGITWLGQYGKDSNGLDQNLIIDSTGITPNHIDSNGHVVPEGVQIRPFGAPGTPNDWYYTHVGHVLRLIKADATATEPIAGSALPTVGADDHLTRLRDDDTADALLVIRPRPGSASLPSLESLAYQSLADRTYLTREQFAAEYGADPSDVQAVENWAFGQGLKVESVDPATRMIRVSGKVSSLENAFGTTLYDGQDNVNGPWVYKGEIGVPVALHDVIQGVFSVAPTGSASQASPSPSSDGQSGSDGYTPAELADRFQFPDATGAGQTIGIIETAGVVDDAARRDFNTYFSSQGLATPTILTVGQGTPASDDELYLDVEVAGALAPDATLVVYAAGGGAGNFFESIQDAVHDASHKLDVLSISDSIPEPYLSSMYLDVASRAFLEAAAMGVSVFTSAGDYGSSRDIPDGLAHVEFPSSSPWVTSVGGTSIKRGEDIDNEVVWNNYTIQDHDLSAGKGATGGGVSAHFAMPDYQKHVDRGEDPRSVNPGNAKGRGGPDVASIADPQTGILIYARGQFLHDGGTSAGAPTWAGLAARINQGLGKNVGFYNTLLYGDLSEAGVTHDVTSGDNTSSHVDIGDKQIPTYLGYDAHAGWDMTTGWGSPIGTSLLDQLKILLKKKED
ncbi:Pseudomonalisin precursor [Aquisphaera giovannonii]|uniref:Pseudomonalisin n=1 Tax=Aquisphaera giovannonii TaxID=406548 RepID=A0A5B9W8W8_9BACT|nr:FG-GAP-like repeat-containing protein [Aquisphaera giovannonii]QEH36629.1 Pseudomonalisin precursor [Aquisphaera giovannonii]